MRAPSARWFSAAAVAVLVLYLGHQLLTRTFDVDDPNGLLRPFDVDNEASIANWLGTIGWFVAAMWLWRWGQPVLAVLAGVLSLEEALDRRDVYVQAFPRAVVLLLALAVLVVVVRTVRGLPAGTARLLAPGLVCWVVGARLADELARIWFWAGTASYDLAVGVEEGLELAGLGLVLRALEKVLAPAEERITAQ